MISSFSYSLKYWHSWKSFTVIATPSWPQSPFSPFCFLHHNFWQATHSLLTLLILKSERDVVLYHGFSLVSPFSPLGIYLFSFQRKGKRVCVHVFLCVYVCLCVPACGCVHVSLCLCISVCAFLCVSVCLCLSVCLLQVCLCRYLCLSICAFVCISVCKCVTFLIIFPSKSGRWKKLILLFFRFSFTLELWQMLFVWFPHLHRELFFYWYKVSVVQDE